MKRLFLASVVFAMCLAVSAETISLPKANITGGMPVMEALAARSSSRDYTAGAVLSQQELSDLLWSANGFNRDDKRTAPSAINAQAIDIYVFDGVGIWLYQPKEQALELVKQGDYREVTGMQPFVKLAAVNLLFVYDMDRWPGKGKPDGKYAVADASFCAENVYLYCASAGLKTVVRGSFQNDKLRALLQLPENKIIALAQSVGK